MITVDVIIPTLAKNQAYYDLCASSLVKHTRAFKPVVFRALNGHDTPYPQGQCAAVNREAAKGMSEWLMIVNDDMYFPSRWDTFVGFNNLLCWSPNLIEPVGHASAPPFAKCDGGDSLDTFHPSIVDGFVLGHMLAAKERKADWETGFNLPFFIRRDVWEAIGGYDTYYDPWGSNSDTDLQMKIELAGVTPIRNRDCLVYHFGSKSGTFEVQQQEFWQQNWDYLKQKWGFDRDEAKSDTWYCKNMIVKDKLIYHPKWEGQYK